MADQFENQLPQKSDAKWVRALDASGNPILISKEDLASVVGGLIANNKQEYTKSLKGVDIRCCVWYNIVQILISGTASDNIQEDLFISYEISSISRKSFYISNDSYISTRDYGALYISLPKGTKIADAITGPRCFFYFKN